MTFDEAACCGAEIADLLVAQAVPPRLQIAILGGALAACSAGIAATRLSSSAFGPSAQILQEIQGFILGLAQGSRELAVQRDTRVGAEWVQSDRD